MLLFCAVKREVKRRKIGEGGSRAILENVIRRRISTRRFVPTGNISSEFD